MVKSFRPVAILVAVIENTVGSSCNEARIPALEDSSATKRKVYKSLEIAPPLR